MRKPPLTVIRAVQESQTLGHDWKAAAELLRYLFPPPAAREWSLTRRMILAKRDKLANQLWTNLLNNTNSGEVSLSPIHRESTWLAGEPAAWSTLSWQVDVLDMLAALLQDDDELVVADPFASEAS